MDPLVEEYLRKKAGLDQNVDEARTKADWMDAGSQIGQGLADSLTPKNTVVYEKGWNETGAPKTESFANKAADFSGLKTMGQRDLQAAQENRNQGLQDMETSRKLEDLTSERQRTATKFTSDMATADQSRNKQAADMARDANLNKPGTSEAKAFAQFMQRAVPGSPDLSGLSLARQKELTGDLFRQWESQHKVTTDKGMDPRVVERLGKDTEEKSGIINAFNQVESLLGLPLQTGLKGQPDVPGVTLPLIGKVKAYSPEAKQLGSAISAITNEISRTNFGVSQSADELKRLANELSTGSFNSEAEQMDALARMKNLYIKAIQDTQAKYPEAARNAYKSQGGMIGGDLQPAQPTAGQMPPGAVRMQRSKVTGQVRYLDAQGNEVK